VKRINTADGRFHDSDQFTHGTVISADWLNNIQEELAGIVEYFGGTVNGSVPNQVARSIFQAIQNGPTSLDCGSPVSYPDGLNISDVFDAGTVG